MQQFFWRRVSSFYLLFSRRRKIPSRKTSGFLEVIFWACEKCPKNDCRFHEKGLLFVESAAEKMTSQNFCDVIFSAHFY